MKKRRWIGMIGLLSITLLAGTVAAQSISRLSIQFLDMDPHVGQRMEARLVEVESGNEVAHRILEAIPSGTFDIEFLGVRIGEAYTLDLYADLNGNQAYDAPPVDHAWRIAIPVSENSTEIVFSHTVDFTDVMWPPMSGPAEIDGKVTPGEYTRSFTEPATGVRILWRNNATHLVLAMVSPGTGWVSVGFDPENAMQGADYILGAMIDGALLIEDHFGTGRFRHEKDDLQNILEAAGTEDGGRTTVEFRIPLDSGDSWDKPLVPGEIYPLLVAYHASSDSLSARHTHRGIGEITLD